MARGSWLVAVAAVLVACSGGDGSGNGTGGSSGAGGASGGAGGSGASAGSGGATGGSGGATGGSGGATGGSGGATGGSGGATGGSGGSTGGSGGSTGGSGGSTGGSGGSTGGSGGSTGGSGGSTGGSGGSTGGSGGGTTCPAAPGSATAAQKTALSEVNAARTAAGDKCARMVASLNTSTTKHCTYYAANKSAGANQCIANPHNEVSGCKDYVAVNFWQRMQAAGYSGAPAFEDMAFANNPTAAVAMWINSVWHRTPILSPWVVDVGYGKATGCDTMDFGTGSVMAASTVVTWPYAGQTSVPPSFSGNEGPKPPAPPGGFPSGYPITLFAKGASITSHTLTVAGNSTPISHQWLTPATQTLLRDAYVMYADKPLASKTKYRVTIKGTHTGGTLNESWTFTTQ